MEKVFPLRYKLQMQAGVTFEGYTDTGDDRRDTNDINEAQTATSKSVLGYHYPVLDIDMPAWLVPSSTPGHSHLYIDHAMPWGKYVKLLEALAEVGIIEEGYAKASIARGFTSVRLPWVKKAGVTPDATQVPPPQVPPVDPF